MMLSLTTFADELERERGRQRTYDAMQRKARAGHVTEDGCLRIGTSRLLALIVGGRTWNAK